MAPQRIVCLERALQGGGAHGAFTWGVLNRLLDCLFRVRLHRIAAAEGDCSSSARGKFNAVWSYLQRLHRRGSEDACTWLSHHLRTLGRVSTFCGDDHDGVTG
ncbi:MAG: hypothetical protein FP826_12315 [Sphingomonadales bacterium]|nr:hypothetical protein [Sphingomonadales bacterium]